jgi:hypothetical protein
MANIPEDAILHNHRRENLKSYEMHEFLTERQRHIFLASHLLK